MSRVLVVEDNTDLRTLYDRMLRLEGYETVLAANGKEAMSLLDQLLKKEDAMPDVIILDLMMPVMDGWEFLRERDEVHEFKAIPVLVCSAVRDEFPPGYEVVRKPIEMANLLKLVEKHCLPSN